MPLTLEYLDPRALTPQARNPWDHPQAQADGLSAAIDAAGWAGAAVLNRATGRIIDGHLRREEAIRRGELLPTLVGEWTEAQERLLLRTINPLAMLAEQNAELLAALDAELAADFDAGALVPDARLAAICAEVNGNGAPQGPTLLTDPDELPEKAPPRVQAGELWACGDHRILCANVAEPAALAALFGEERAACLVTSPPYYGLRAYGTEPCVWGGETGCGHDWEASTREGQSGGPSDKQDSNAGSRFEDQPCATCRLCGAWRGELGLEPTPALYVEHMVDIFRALRGVLREDGTCWVNMGDSYSGNGTGPGRNDTDRIGASVGSANPVTPAGSKYASGGDEIASAHKAGDRGLPPKNLLGMPWRLAFALQADGWVLRSDIVWSKPNPMPESVTDRPTKAHEFVFLLAQRERYFYDADAVREEAEYGRREWPHGRIAWDMGTDGFRLPGANGPSHPCTGRNRRTVWEIPPRPYAEAHFATYPVALVTPCLLAGTSAKGQCPHCGKAWERVTERDDPAFGRRDYPSTINGRQPGNTIQQGGYLKPRTLTILGWRPACRCAEGDPVPAIVFDPFLGAGTNLIAAEQHGRRAYGVELQPAYCDLAIARWEAATGKRAERLS